MEISEILNDYITNEFLEDKLETVSYDDDLLSTGILDSIGMIRFISFIEKEFNIQVSSEDMTFDNFMSIEKITDYIQKKK
jgi:acyl carrier protein